MKKKVVSMFLATALAATMLAGCGSKDSEDANAKEDAGTSSESEGTQDDAADNQDSSEGGEEDTEFAGDIALRMWGAEEDQAMLQEMIDAFVEEYKDQANITVELGTCSEAKAKDEVTTDVEAAPDVYAFASDQLSDLVAAGALQEVSLNTEQVIEANGGAEAGVVKAATYDGKLYAYPETADNGYYMFYNKEYFSEDDVKSLEKMMDAAADKGKKITLDMTSGWYTWAFFGGAGFELTKNEDRTNSCNINDTSVDGIKGTEVLQAILDVCANPGFVSLKDEAFVAGVKDGSIVAGVNGPWNAKTAEDAWGENYAAAKLPTYKVAGKDVQMASFAGYKMVGVNPHSQNVGYAMLLAEWITNEENQAKRFTVRGAAPSNVKAAAADEVQASVSVAAIAAQSQFAALDGVQTTNYFDSMEALGGICIDGNPDGTDLQELLDNAVQGITQPVAQ